MHTDKTYVFMYTHTHTYTQLNKAHSHATTKAEPTWRSMAKICKCCRRATHYPLPLDVRQASLLVTAPDAHTSTTPRRLPEMSRIVLLILTLPNISWMDAHAWFIQVKGCELIDVDSLGSSRLGCLESLLHKLWHPANKLYWQITSS